MRFLLIAHPGSPCSGPFLLPALGDLLGLALVLTIAGGLGRWLLRRAGFGFSDLAAELALALPLGLGGLGLGTLGLGLGGVLDPPAVWLMLAALGLLTHREIVATARAALRRVAGSLDRSRRAGPAAASPRPPWSKLEKLVWIGVITTSTCSLIGALAPPTAGDALCYHLEVPRRFIEHHGLVYLPYVDNTVYPLLMEMLYALGLIVRGPELAACLHWLAGPVLLLSVAELARPVLGRRLGWLAAGVFLVTPGVHNQMTAALNDLGLAMMVVPLFLAYFRWVETGRLRWLLLGGVFGGLALGVKHLALFIMVLVVLDILRMIAGRRLPLGRGLAAIAGFAAVGLLVSGVWYLRAGWHTGNPVYPFFPSLFGGAGSAAKLGRQKRPIAMTPLAWLIAPWTVTMHPERIGGIGHQLGLVGLALAPAALLLRPPRRIGHALALTAGYGLLWLGSHQNVRFLLPVVPLVVVAAVWAWDRLRRTGGAPARLLTAALAAMVLANTAIGVARCRAWIPLAAGIESRATYLARREPSDRMARYINAHLPRTAVILTQDHRSFYIDRTLVREPLWRPGAGSRCRPPGPDGLWKRARAAGITHALIVSAAEPGHAPRPNPLAAAAAACPGVCRPLESYTFRDREGIEWSYCLIRLGVPKSH